MFDEFDILRKEVSNDFFKLECVIETEAMRDQILSIEDVMTEAEDGSTISEKINALKAKVTEIFQKIADKFKEAIQKIIDKIQSGNMEARAEKLKKDLVDLIEDCKKDPELAKKVNDELDAIEGVRIEDLDVTKVQKYVASRADKIAAWLKNSENKISKGKLVTPEEIAEAKAMGDIEPFKFPDKVKLGLSIGRAVAGVAQLVGIFITFKSMRSFDTKKSLSGAILSVVGRAVAAGCGSIKSIETKDGKNVARNQDMASSEDVILSNATQVANAVAYVENRLRAVEVDAYAEQVRILTGEINSIKAVVKKYRKEKSSGEASKSSEEAAESEE